MLQQASGERRFIVVKLLLMIDDLSCFDSQLQTVTKEVTVTLPKAVRKCETKKIKVRIVQ